MGNTQPAASKGNAATSPVSDSGSSSFTKGDRVQVTAKSEAELERLCDGHGGYNPKMGTFIGKTGVIRRVLGSAHEHDVMVRFDESDRDWRFNTAALKKTSGPSFTPKLGQVVRLIKEIDQVKKLQVGHGNWVDDMTLALGDKAKIIKLYPDGDIRVKMVEGIMGSRDREYTLNPLCVTLVSSDAGSKPNSSSSSDGDVNQEAILRLLRRMLQSGGDDDDDDKEKKKGSDPQKMMTENGTLAQLYENKRFLGQGGFGVVMKASHYLEKGAPCAVKVVGFNRDELASVLREVQSLASLTTHPNIVSYKCCWIEKLSEVKVDGLKERLAKVRSGSNPELILCVRLECCEGNLDDYVGNRNKKFFRDDEYKSDRSLRDGRNFTDRGYTNYKAIFIDILRGLKFLHEKKIIHRDIKPSNILYDKNLDFKFTDFGLAKNVAQLSKDLMSNCGTICYAAPEQLLRKRYGLSADIYPLGLVLFELMYPIKNMAEFESLFSDLRTDRRLPPGLTKCYPEISKLIVQMLDEDPDKRPSLERLLTISWKDI